MIQISSHLHILVLTLKIPIISSWYQEQPHLFNFSVSIYLDNKKKLAGEIFCCSCCVTECNQRYQYLNTIVITLKESLLLQIENIFFLNWKYDAFLAPIFAAGFLVCFSVLCLVSTEFLVLIDTTTNKTGSSSGNKTNLLITRKRSD